MGRGSLLTPPEASPHTVWAQEGEQDRNPAQLSHISRFHCRLDVKAEQVERGYPRHTESVFAGVPLDSQNIFLYKGKNGENTWPGIAGKVFKAAPQAVSMMAGTGSCCHFFSQWVAVAGAIGR